MELKIRIFALAKELGMDSKILIEACNAAGIKVKSSPLASISPEEKDLVLSHMKGSGGSAATAVAEAPPTPHRIDPSRDLGGKIRAIRAVPARPVVREELPSADQDDEPVDDDGGTVAPVEVAAEALPETETATETPTGGAGTAPSMAPVPATPMRNLLRRGAGEGKADTPEMQARPVTPLRPDDYISPGGVRSGSSMREMRPRGTILESDASQKRPAKPKAKPALPNIAAPPNYKPPVARGGAKEEAPAQKPDIPLSGDVFNQNSPLRAHLKKNAEQKKKRKKGDEVPAGPIDTSAFVSEEAAGEKKSPIRDRRENWRRSADGGEGERRRRTIRGRQRRSEPVALKSEAELGLPITVRSLSEAMGRPAKDLMRALLDRGEMVSINQILAEETAMELAIEFGIDLTIRRPKDIEQELAQVLDKEEDEATLVERPPIVTILGHVDHGKTTLLDKIRSANVAAGEAGGITQHIAAYQVEHNGKKLTFVDTPGHAAFSEMRARGANVTDIVVLVVAADDGVMPQTVECISHARAAGVPIVVAMNKVDLPNRNEQRVLQELSSNNVLPAEWGGDTEVIRTSATTGQGLDNLLETLLVTAELKELKSSIDRPAVGVCLEAFRDEGRGVLAWIVVQKGTLRVGDMLLCGEAFGRIRAMYDDHDRAIDAAGPSTPVTVAGLDVMPGAGDRFWVMSNAEEAREAAAKRRAKGRAANLVGQARPRSLDDILTAARGGEVQDLPLIVKADSQGSIEAIRSEMQKFEHPEVRVTIVHEGVGGVNESDVSLAEASGAIIVAFHVVPEERARVQAERDGVDIRRFEIIYEVIDTIKRSLEGLLLPEKQQVDTGRLIVLKIFPISRVGTIAGCRVLRGTIDRSNRINVVRDQTILNSYSIASLKRGKDDAREVREGMECGIRLDGFNDVKEGDLLDAYRIEEIKRTLE